ncbi:MAG: hypothetical protein IIW01_12095 [Thermoguttaceae bacterium]|nr:hypothetical protein [Thermoguttaceae bacterium]
MSAIKYRELKRRYELDGAQKTVAHLSEALAKQELRADDFSIRDLAEALVPNGSEWVRELNPNVGSLAESFQGVDVSAFATIAGQLIYSRILESYHSEVFCLSKLITTIPTRLNGEKIPGFASIADAAVEIEPGAAYPNVGFGEDYIETPETTKRGLIVPVTREAVFFDRTHVVLNRASEVGETLALNKEKRIADMILGLSNLYQWNGTAYSTYYASSTASAPWVNMLSGNALESIENVDAAENLLASALDPNTGEPILSEANVALVSPAKRRIANVLLRGANLSCADGTLRSIPNPFEKISVVSSRIARRQLAKANASADAGTLDDYWFYGDFKKAFAYMENWPITVSVSSAGSEADFSQDVVARFKASERGATAVLNPRCVVKCVG